MFLGLFHHRRITTFYPRISLLRPIAFKPLEKLLALQHDSGEKANFQLVVLANATKLPN